MNSSFSYPKWEELPELDLYLDQVLLYVNQVCKSTISHRDKGLTASMINNYVKHGYISKPSKKKYQKHQVARLIAITTLKTVFSIQEITDTLNALRGQAESPQLYDKFAAYMNGEDIHVSPIIASSCETVKLYHQTLALVTPKEESHER